MQKDGEVEIWEVRDEFGGHVLPELRQDVSPRRARPWLKGATSDMDEGMVGGLGELVDPTSEDGRREGVEGEDIVREEIAAEWGEKGVSSRSQVKQVAQVRARVSRNGTDYSSMSWTLCLTA